MELTLTTPALLFPTISLLMVAYSNRFLTIAGRIRSLHETYKNTPSSTIKEQIKSLKIRLQLIKNMQALGVASLFFMRTLHVCLIRRPNNGCGVYFWGGPDPVDVLSCPLFQRSAAIGAST